MTTQTTNNKQEESSATFTSENSLLTERWATPKTEFTELIEESQKKVDNSPRPNWVKRCLSRLQFRVKGKPLTATGYYETRRTEPDNQNHEWIGPLGALQKLLQVINDAPFPTWRERRAARKSNPNDPTGGAKVTVYDVCMAAEELEREITHTDEENERTRLSLGQLLGALIHVHSTDVYVGNEEGPDLATDSMWVKARSFNLSSCEPSAVLIDQDHDGLTYCALGVTDEKREEWEWFITWKPLSHFLNKRFDFGGVNFNELASIGGNLIVDEHKE